MSAAQNIIRRAAQRLKELDALPPMVVHTAPGRVDVIGGLVSQAGGVVAQMALPRRAAVALRPRSDGRLIFASARMGTGPAGRSDSTGSAGETVSFSADDLFPALGQSLPEPQLLMSRISPGGHWALPFVALFFLLAKERCYGETAPSESTQSVMRGATVVIESEIAIHAAQGSSTAIVAALLQAVNRVTPLNLSTLEKAVLIHQAEGLFGPSSGHVVDALTILCAMDGPPAHLLRYSAQPHDLMGQIPLSRDVRLFALNTGISVQRSDETFLALRLAGEMGLRIIETIYRDLGQNHTPLHGYLANLSPELYRRYFRSLLPRRLRGGDFLRTYGELPTSVGPVLTGSFYRVRAAVDHLISEREHAENFLQAMEELAETASLSDAAESNPLDKRQRRLTLQRAGRLLLASQHSYRLRLGLSCPQADWLVSQLMRAGPASGVFGSRISECGGGGTVIAMVDSSSQATDALLQIVSDYPRVMGLPMELQMAGAAGSAGAVLNMVEELVAGVELG